MEYYLYSLDTDTVEILHKMLNSQGILEDILIELKTRGEYLISYSEKNFYELIAKLGEKNARIMTKNILDLVELKEIYNNTDPNLDNEILREFKLKIYKAISECRCIYILKMEKEVEEVNSTNFLDNFKNRIKNRLGKN